MPTPRDQRIIGSKPAQPKQTDPETERVRDSLKNPFAKHYGAHRGADQR